MRKTTGANHDSLASCGSAGMAGVLENRRPQRLLMPSASGVKSRQYCAEGRRLNRASHGGGGARQARRHAGTWRLAGRCSEAVAGPALARLALAWPMRRRALSRAEVVARVRDFTDGGSIPHALGAGPAGRNSKGVPPRTAFAAPQPLQEAKVSRTTFASVCVCRRSKDKVRSTDGTPACSPGPSSLP